MLYVYTGNGKGKTTAAIGQIVRSLGRGWKVCLIQLFKGKEFYGEQKVLTKLKNLKFYSFAPKHPGCFPKTDRAVVRAQCLKALNRARTLLSGPKKFDLIVLEEFNIAVRDGFLSVEDLLEVISDYTNKYDIIITGRTAHKELLSRADLVTEMQEIKHYFKKGIIARKGMEF